MEDGHRKLDEFLNRIHADQKNWKTDEYPAFAPPGSAAESWRQCHQLAERYDKGMCDAYREQIDTLLVFAGLFSAVLTAFTIESYQWLDNSAEDAAVQLLSQIAGSLSGSGALISTASLSSPPASSLTGSVATRINIYWFMSLALSLSAALVGILVKQWIREYETDVGRTPREALAVRQMRHEGLETWGVTTIVTFVPVLLQAALLLFLTGILELLWVLNRLVAMPLTLTIALVSIFYVVTSVLPAAQFLFWSHSTAEMAQCPYKSPQGWLVLKATASLITHFSSQDRVHSGWEAKYMQQPVNKFLRARSWKDFDLAWTLVNDNVARAWTLISDSPKLSAQYSFRSLPWLKDAVDHPDLPTWTWHCLWDSVQPSNRSPQTRGNILWILESEDHPIDTLQPPLPAHVPDMGLLFKYAESHLPGRAAGFYIINALCEICATSNNLSVPSAIQATMDLVSALECGSRGDPLPVALCQRALLCADSIGKAGTYSAFRFLLKEIFERTLATEIMSEDRMVTFHAICAVARRTSCDGSHNNMHDLADITDFSRLLEGFYSCLGAEPNGRLQLSVSEAAHRAQALSDAWALLPKRPSATIEEYLRANEVISARLAAEFRRLAAVSGHTPRRIDSAEPVHTLLPDAKLHPGHPVDSSRVIPADRTLHDIGIPAHEHDIDVSIGGTACAAPLGDVNERLAPRTRLDVEGTASVLSRESSASDEPSDVHNPLVLDPPGSLRAAQLQGHIPASESSPHSMDWTSGGEPIVIADPRPSEGMVRTEHGRSSSGYDRGSGIAPSVERGPSRRTPLAALQAHNARAMDPPLAGTADLETPAAPRSVRATIECLEIGDLSDWGGDNNV